MNKQSFSCENCLCLLKCVIDFDVSHAFRMLLTRGSVQRSLRYLSQAGIKRWRWGNILQRLKIKWKNGNIVFNADNISTLKLVISIRILNIIHNCVNFCCPICVIFVLCYALLAHLIRNWPFENLGIASTFYFPSAIRRNDLKVRFSRPFRITSRGNL